MSGTASRLKGRKGSRKCNQPRNCNPSCNNAAERGPDTRRDLSQFGDGTVESCPKFGPKSIGTVNMGENSVIDIKIARTGVRGNHLRTDRCATILKEHLDQSALDRHALHILK